MKPETPPSRSNITIPVVGIEAAVCRDISDRQLRGIAKYGTTVSDNPLTLLEWHQHHYEELLDAAVYTKKIIEELKKQNVN